MPDTKKTTGEDGTIEIKVSDNDILHSVTRYNPQNLEIVYGLEVPEGISLEDFIRIRRVTDRYTKAETQSIDKFLNTVISVCGCMMHLATFAYNNGPGSPPIYDADTGELVEQKKAYRQIIKVCAVNGKKVEPFYISFGSAAIEEELKTSWIPLLGIGDWSRTVNFIVRSVPTKRGGHTYNMEVAD